MDRRQIVGALILTAVVIAIGVIIPLTIGLGTGELRNIQDKIDFYNRFYPVLFVIWGVLLTFMLIKKRNVYGSGIGFFNIGEKPASKFFSRFTGFQLTLLSTIFFSIIFLTTNILKNGGLTKLAVLPQQAFSKTQSLLFSSALIPVPENLLLLAVTSLFMLVLTLICIKYKVKASEYFIYLYVGLFIIGGIFGVVWHNTAYPSDDSKIVIFFFWGLGAVINVATGFFVVFWIIHILNNFFIDFTRLYSSDTLLVLMVIVIVSLIALYVALYRKNLLGEGRKEKGILT